MHLALVRSRGSSNLECEASSCTCGLRGGATFAAQGRAVREVVHATVLPASIYTTPTRYRISATGTSSGNPVIYNCSNPGLCGTKFLFLLAHIPTWRIAEDQRASGRDTVQRWRTVISSATDSVQSDMHGLLGKFALDPPEMSQEETIEVAELFRWIRASLARPFKCELSTTVAAL